MAKYISEFTGIEIDERLSKVNEEFTSEEKEKLAALENYDDSEILAVVGDKVDKVEGKGLSTNDFTNEEKDKLSVLENYDDSGITKSIEDLEENKANAADVYNKEETDTKITEKVAEIVAGAPEEFDTLKEMSDWLTEHSDSAATMNTAIQENTKAITDNTTAIEGNTADIEQNKNNILSAEKAIEINQRSIGMQVSKNVFDLKNWEKSLIGATRGQVEDVENGIKFTHDNSNTATAYTNPYLDSNAKTHKIPVEANTEYILSWETNTVNSGFIRVYFNGQSTYYEDIANTGNINSKKFKTTSVTRYLSLQLRIDTAGESTTFTNIMIREADITDDIYEPYVPSVNERLTVNENDISSLEQHKMGYEYGYAYAKNDTNVGWFKVASFSCPAIGSTLRRATFFVTGVGASNTGVLSVQVTSVTGTTPGIGAIACSWAYNQLTTSGGKYITNIPTDSFKAIGNLDGNMIRVELWCRIDSAYFVLKSRLLNFESRTDFLSISEVEMYSSSTATTEEPTGAVNTISSYNLRKELDNLTARITALEAALSQTQTE